MTGDLKDELAANGFAVVERAVVDPFIETLAEGIKRIVTESGIDKPYRLRNLTYIVPEVAELAQTHAMRELVEPVLGTGAFVVQSLFFDKTPQAIGM